MKTIDFQRIASDLNAEYSSGTAPGVWNWTRGSDGGCGEFVPSIVVFFPTRGLPDVAGEPVQRDHARLKLAIHRALVNRLLLDVAACTGFTLKTSMQDGEWLFVSANDEDAVVAVRAYASEAGSRMWIGGSNVPVTNLASWNINKVVRKHMAKAEAQAIQDRADKESIKAQKTARDAIVDGLRARGICSTTTTHMKNDGVEKIDGGFSFTLNYQRTGIEADITSTGSVESIIAETERRVRILETL